MITCIIICCFQTIITGSDYKLAKKYAKKQVQLNVLKINMKRFKI